jgi:hypothetical protein
MAGPDCGAGAAAAANDNGQTVLADKQMPRPQPPAGEQQEGLRQQSADPL